MAEAFGLSIPGMPLGSGMWDMTYTTEQLPPAEAAHKASQLESGGGGIDFNINAALKDLAGIWLANESRQNQWATVEQQQAWLRAQNGTVYPAGQYMSAPQQSGGGVSFGTLLLIGLVVGAVVLLKDD